MSPSERPAWLRPATAAILGLAALLLCYPLGPLLQEIGDKQHVPDFVKRVKSKEAKSGHEVVGLLQAVASEVREKAPKMNRYLHYGLTSSDVLDTAFALQLVEATDLLLSGWRAAAKRTTRIFHMLAKPAGRSADFQSAVSRVSNPLRAGPFPTPCRLEVGLSACDAQAGDTAGWKPALRAFGTQSGKEVCEICGLNGNHPIGTRPASSAHWVNGRQSMGERPTDFCKRSPPDENSGPKGHGPPCFARTWLSALRE